jgi:hypothetical protein
LPGYIKLYRKLLDNPIFQNEKILKVFIWCLLKASYTEHEQLVGLQKVILHPGQFVYGRLKASEELKIKPSTCNDIITWLKREQIIDIKTNNKFSLITIVNWDLYQVDEEESDSKTDNKPTTNRQQSNTNKKGKEREERKEVIYIPTLDEVKAYCKERKNKVDPQKWYDFYSAKGWMIGKNKMKDWKAAVRTWEHEEKPQNKPPQASNFNQRPTPTDEECERLYKDV